MIKNANIDFSIQNGESFDEAWISRANLRCPCCGNITEARELKKQFITHSDTRRLICIIYEKHGKRMYQIPDQKYLCTTTTFHGTYRPIEPMPVKYTQALPSCTWGIEKWGELFSERQLFIINLIKEKIISVKDSLNMADNYNSAVVTYLTLLLDRILVRYTEFGVWHILQETVEHTFGRQAIPMKFSYPEMNPFSNLSGSFFGQLSSILDFINEENSFRAYFVNSSSGEKNQFPKKSISAVVTDPPYYDAIAYADLSDFFYVWQKNILSDIYPEIFSTPLTPKTEECTALRHRANGDFEKAKCHFETKLTDIFDAIELQTSDIVSIMFAHQSTEAWTTLCNSILKARMNITGSWPIDTEVQGALKTDKGFLESSVTVACRPSSHRGFGDFKEVKQDIKTKVAEEVESLYELGFRGSDLLTACFGQAVSEFGQYEAVEKADGSTVTVAELLELARSSAFDALLKGIKADDYTRFYIGWLQLNGMGECDSDDATKFTRVGVNIEVNEIKAQHMLIVEGNKVRLATAEEHLGSSRLIKDIAQQPIIYQVHRAILLYREGEKAALLSLIKECAPQSSDQFWRVLATLKELLPTGPDLKDVTGLLLTQDTLRVDCQKDFTPQMPSLFDEL